MIKRIQDRADEIETQAEELIKRACEKLQAAQSRVQSLDAEQRASEISMNEAKARILNAEKALERARS